MILAEFENLVRTPADVDRLNQTILELAVRGKLVPQDGADEPASALLARIRAEKRRLESAGEIRKSEPLAAVEAEEIPFLLPEGWVWVRLGQVADYGQSSRTSDGAVTDDTWVLDLADIESRTSNLIEKVRYCDREFKSSKNVFESGDVLYGKLRPYLDKVLVADESGVCTTEIIPIRPFLPDLDPYFLRYVMKSPYFLEYVNSRTYGMRMPRLGTSDGQAVPFPLPPLAEQRRIVGRVDSLLARTAALKESLAAAQAERETLAAAALHRLENAADPAQSATAWALIRENFAALIDTPQSVAALKQTILQLAVQGKLVAQDAADEPAAELLVRIRAEKKRLEEAGEMRTSKPLTKVSAEEMPFALPAGWVWARLGDAGLINPRNSASDETEASFVPMTLIDDGIGSRHDAEIRKWGEIRTGFTHFAEGDIGVAKITPCFQNRKSVIFSRLQNGIGAGTTELHIFRPLVGAVDPRYALAFFQSKGFISEGLAKMTGTAGQQRVPRPFFEEVPLPLPPLAEQQRIVARVDALFALCDGLAAELSAAEETRARWVASALAGV